MTDRCKWLCINGKIVPLNKGLVLANDRGLLLGDGIFETMFYDGRQLEDFNDHWQRLERSLSLFEISFPFSTMAIEQQIMELLKLNQLLNKTASVRLTITRGAAERGLQIPSSQMPTSIIQVAAYQRSIVPVTISFSKHCHFGASALSAVKHLGYQLSILGRLEARNQGVDDVLFLNQAGEVVSATAANVFAIIEGEFVTPSLSSGCLPGVKRARVIQLLEEKGHKVVIRSLLPEEIIEKSVTVFLTNSLVDIQAVKEVIKL